jgi:hypothetical protein
MSIGERGPEAIQPFKVDISPNFQNLTLGGGFTGGSTRWDVLSNSPGFIWMQVWIDNASWNTNNAISNATINLPSQKKFLVYMVDFDIIKLEPVFSGQYVTGFKFRSNTNTGNNEFVGFTVLAYLD